VDRRTRQLQSLAEVQRVIAFTELAALKANHGNGATATPRVKRRWADVRRGVRAARRVSSVTTAVADTGANGAQSRPSGELPSPLHELAIEGTTLKCSNCRKTADKTRRTALAYSRCPANLEGQQWEWKRVPHVVADGVEHISCSRCGGSVPMCRRAAFEGRRCPAWNLEPPGAGAVGPDWGAWYFNVLGYKVAGKCAPQRGRTAPPNPAEVAEEQAAPRNRTQDVLSIMTGKAWRPHTAACGPGHVACMSCGTSARSWATLQARPCTGWRESSRRESRL
jgi:hypothetical protein